MRPKSGRRDRLHFAANAVRVAQDLPIHENDPLTDGDAEHLRSLQNHGNSLSPLIREGLFLVRSILAAAPQPWGAVATNDLSATACFVRAYRQVRAATVLAAFGYYSEVPTILRACYEAGALGRYLAKNPEKADEWISKEGWLPRKKEGWIPDREVRNWFGDGEGTYASFYGSLSKRAHPTAISCIPLLSPQEDTYVPRFASEWSDVEFEASLFAVLSVLLWLCFALRNAAPHEDALPASWRKALTTWAKRVGKVSSKRTGMKVDFDHLDRNWQAEYRKWKKYTSRLAGAKDIDALLDDNPFSWRNLKQDEDE